MVCHEATQRIPDAPRSAKTVLCTLAERGPMTMKDIQLRSGLARRTVYGAVRRLREMGLLSERPNLHDTRQTWYSLAA